MLADAARLQLKLQLRPLDHGYSLKDASAHNSRFMGAEPVFVDIPSIEVPERQDIRIATRKTQDRITTSSALATARATMRYVANTKMCRAFSRWSATNLVSCLDRPQERTQSSDQHTMAGARSCSAGVPRNRLFSSRSPPARHRGRWTPPSGRRPQRPASASPK